MIKELAEARTEGLERFADPRGRGQERVALPYPPPILASSVRNALKRSGLIFCAAPSVRKRMKQKGLREARRDPFGRDTPSGLISFVGYSIVKERRDPVQLARTSTFAGSKLSLHVGMVDKDRFGPRSMKVSVSSGH